MTLAPGLRFGHYDVLAQLGVGGMGVVYRAHDTTLGRDVALKVLPEALVADPSRVARFEREARTLAALSHPNIAGIHGLETVAGVTALVLELVEGPTLEDRITRGPIPLDEALGLAQQIAGAIQAAHEHGIIHRDLKPANIKLRRDGTVKVLDFGLAKALGGPAEDEATVTSLATHVGTIMGTPAYMSPEQARGETVDRQADIWSFGVILYEVLSGASPFQRPTTTDTLASVVGSTPDLARLPAPVPQTIRRLVRRCLEKDRTRRMRDIGDARLDIEDARAELSAGAPAAGSSAPVRRHRAWWQVAGVAALTLGVGVAGWLVGSRSAGESVGRAAWLAMPSFERPSAVFGARYLAISEDGSRFAFTSGIGGRLWIRRMNQAAPTVVEVFATNPFFSPGGDWVGFFRVGSDAGLVKVPAVGGVPVVLVPTPDRGAGGTWRSDGTIVYATSAGLYEVTDQGGEPRLLAKPDLAKKERGYAWPRFMPDGQSVLFTILADTIDATAIARLDLESGETTVVLRGGTTPRYVPDGRLVYASGQNLMAVAVDPKTLRVQGTPVMLPEHEIATSSDTGAAQFDISDTGTLVFAPPMEIAEAFSTLSWLDRNGREEAIGLAPGRYLYPRVSPDGMRIALDVLGDNRDIWIWHTRRATLTRLTNGPTEDVLPAWSVDGSRVFFSSNRTGNFDVYSQAADGATDARLEFAGPGAQLVGSFTPDGTGLLLVEDFKDLGLLRLTPPARVEGLRRTESNEWLGEVSPDGKWLAYESDESGGRVEIFVRPFPDVAGRREQISKDGGRFPKWNPASSGELFYVDPDGGMRAVSLRLSPDLSVGPVTKLFDGTTPSRPISGRPYDVSPVDGRFVISKPATGPTDSRVTVLVVLNWFEELAARMRVDDQ